MAARMMGADLRMEPDGAALYAGALDPGWLSRLLPLAAHLPEGRAGERLAGGPDIAAAAGPGGPLGSIAASVLGSAARPVRAVLFDKTSASNWAVGWHQDRTILVRERVEAPGFGPWSNKQGLTHVEPPFAIMQGMITLRAHLDDCGPDNAPLLVAPGSHRLGRIPADQAAAVAGKLGQAVCLAGAGDVWCYATPILHASERSVRPRRRRVLQLDYAGADLPCGLHWRGLAAAPL